MCSSHRAQHQTTLVIANATLTLYLANEHEGRLFGLTGPQFPQISKIWEKSYLCFKLSPGGGCVFVGGILVSH